jgi:hypothetical protein
MPQEPTIAPHTPGLRDRLTDLFSQRDARSLFKWTVDPLTEAPSSLAKRLADLIDNPQGEGGRMRGFLAGSVEGAGDLLSGFTAPVSAIPAAGSAARGGVRAAMNVGARPRSIAEDVYGLSEGPIGRRQFFYNISGAPKKAAEARVNQTPTQIQNIADELANPNMPAAQRHAILQKLEREADLVSVLQNKHGVLNESLRGAVEPGGHIRNWDRTNELRTSIAKPITDLISRVSPGTERKIRPTLDFLSRTGRRTVMQDDPAALAAYDKAVESYRRAVKVPYARHKKIGEAVGKFSAHSVSCWLTS